MPLPQNSTFREKKVGKISQMPPRFWQIFGKKTILRGASGYNWYCIHLISTYQEKQ